jgi:hypothetical protein
VSIRHRAVAALALFAVGAALIVVFDVLVLRLLGTLALASAIGFGTSTIVTAPNLAEDPDRSED